MKKFVVLALALLTMNSWALDPRCQSTNICTYAKFPLLRQSDPKLLAYIAQRTNQNPATYTDPGICAAVANTMVVAAIINEKAQTTRPASSLLSKWTSMDANTAVYNVGSELGTSWKRGGTIALLAYAGFKNFFKFNNQRTYKLEHNGTSFWDSIWDRYNEYPNDQLINNVRNQKHLLQVYFYGAKKKQKKILWETITWYDPDGGHALAINGFDGNRLKVFDPWGSMYMVQTRVEKVKTNPLWSNRVTLVQDMGVPASGLVRYGYVGTNLAKQDLVIMLGYIKVDAH